LYRFQVIASYLSKVANFNLPQLYLVPQLNATRSNFAKIIGARKLGPLG